MSPWSGSPPSPHLSPLIWRLCPSPPGTTGPATRKTQNHRRRIAPLPWHPAERRTFKFLVCFCSAIVSPVPLMKGLSSQERPRTGDSHRATQEGPSICTSSIPGAQPPGPDRLMRSYLWVLPWDQDRKLNPSQAAGCCEPGLPTVVHTRKS